MPKINLLSKEISELIAAGEVVERPASIVKELVENSIDALSKHVTVEIVKGGISYIRITDDGCGISAEDVPLAFKRHATSKIKTAADLEKILTLGFRGEALAATASVSRVELFSATEDNVLGAHYVIEGGNELLSEEIGCPKGTTLIIRDIFYNTPARMKFLKKDSTEGTAVLAVVERAALSHPEIAFKLIREGKTVLSTSGDGKLYSAIYSILGRETANSLIEVDDKSSIIGVFGYTCKPVFCKNSRANQYTFINGRLVRSGTVVAAAEQAYKNSTMIGKFPAFVICLEVPPQTIDVNVHPAKTEVRFSDEKRIFDAVYYAVKSAISKSDTRPELINAKTEEFGKMSAEKYTQDSIKAPAERAINPNIFEKIPEQRVVLKDSVPESFDKQRDEIRFVIPKKPEIKEEPLNTESYIEDIKYIGEAFSTYIIVQKGESVFLIDKHAAHERIIYNKLKKNINTESQALLEAVVVKLSEGEHTAVTENIETLSAIGFKIEDFGNSTVIVRAIPAILSKSDVEAAVVEVAENLSQSYTAFTETMDNIYHTVACKAAIKAGYITSPLEQQSLAKQVLNDKDVMYCPHGRPVAYEIKKKDLEKQFGRIQ